MSKLVIINGNNITGKTEVVVKKSPGMSICGNKIKG